MAKYNRGNLILERFNISWVCATEVSKRFGCFRGLIPGLIEIYLNEMGEGFNPEAIDNPDRYKEFVRDTRAPRLELNEQGDAVVRAFIFAYRNRLDKVINVRKRQDQGE